MGTLHCLSHRHLVCRTQTTTTRRLNACSVVTKKSQFVLSRLKHNCGPSLANGTACWVGDMRLRGMAHVPMNCMEIGSFFWHHCKTRRRTRETRQTRPSQQSLCSASAPKDVMLMMRANRDPGPRPLSFIATARLPSGNWVINSARGTSYPSGPLPCLIWLEVERDPSATTTSPTPDIARAYTTNPVVYGLRRYNGNFTAVPHSTI